jgi:hypothetical protein
VLGAREGFHHGLLDRLLGLETEYAIRWTRDDAGDAGGERPAHDLVHATLTSVIASRQATREGTRTSLHQQLFLENGGAIYYEFLPRAPNQGLIEASTPECRGPSELLLYQKAQEQILLDALPKTNELLRAQGYAGELGLLKNCRDARGNVYGAQENYEVELARGPALLAYRVGLASLMPLIVATSLVAVAFLFAWLVVLIVVTLVLLGGLLALTFVIPRRADALERFFNDVTTRALQVTMRGLNGIGMACMAPGALAYALLYRCCCCRRVRHDVLGFLLSRSIFTGAGTLDPVTGAFGLSEKGPAIRRLVRLTSLPVDRSVFDIGHLTKSVFAITNLELRPLGRLFHRRQRLQLGLSDSNLAQTAEYLKVATTTLVIDMAEAGLLRDLPRVRRPIRALRRLIADPDLRVKVHCSDGVARSAIELQRLYLERARAFVANTPTPSLEAREVVRSWAEVLDALEHDPASLFGRIDWISKRGLLETAGRDLEPAERQTIALKYHELGVGYFAELERVGLAPTLVAPDELTRALTQPPQESPARRRSQLVRALAVEGVKALVSWDRVEIRREGERRQVIRLDDYR